MEISSSNKQSSLSAQRYQEIPSVRHGAVCPRRARTEDRSKLGGAPPLSPSGSTGRTSLRCPVQRGAVIPLFPRVDRRRVADQKAAAMALHPAGKKRSI